MTLLRYPVFICFNINQSGLIRLTLCRYFIWIMKTAMDEITGWFIGRVTQSVRKVKSCKWQDKLHLSPGGAYVSFGYSL